jgi:hypothetical protein
VILIFSRPVCGSNRQKIIEGFSGKSSLSIDPYDDFDGYSLEKGRKKLYNPGGLNDAGNC